MSNSWLRFDPIFPPAIAVAALALFTFFIYQEFRRNQKFLALRTCALCVMGVALLGVLLKPIYEVARNSDAILLLTRNYARNTVDSILKQNPAVKIMRIEDAEPYPNSTVLTSWNELFGENIFCIVGEGIPHHAFDLQRKQSFRFIPAALPHGITSLALGEGTYENQRQVIRGVFYAPAQTTLKLSGPGGAEDSVTFGKGENSFALSFTPRQPGLFTYSLESKVGNIVFQNEQVPVDVAPERQLRLLFLQQQPTAEIRFLKSFLSEKKHHLLLRYKISKSNFMYEYVNTPPIRFATLRPGFLNSLDLVVIDQKSYDELTLMEKDDLKRAVHEGLGVISILHDPKEKLLSEFRKIKFQVGSRDTANVPLLRRQPFSLSVIPFELPSDPSVVAVVKNKNRIFSGYFFSDLGKVGFQFIQETYRLTLEG
ncbi:MAG TPA: hypothetical protein VKQ08_04325, partial [Cyclobacteriaceae bacterium]|nr:hypothetical protein [Cyclobacteriaceae bacterium]